MGGTSAGETVLVCEPGAGISVGTWTTAEDTDSATADGAALAGAGGAEPETSAAAGAELGGSFVFAGFCSPSAVAPGVAVFASAGWALSGWGFGLGLAAVDFGFCSLPGSFFSAQRAGVNDPSACGMWATQAQFAAARQSSSPCSSHLTGPLAFFGTSADFFAFSPPVGASQGSSSAAGGLAAVREGSSARIGAIVVIKRASKPLPASTIPFCTARSMFCPTQSPHTGRECYTLDQPKDDRCLHFQQSQDNSAS